MKNIEKIMWHPAFYGGLQFVLREYKDALEFDSEHELSRKSISMDMLLIKKRKDIVIGTSFGRLFRKYNIVDYKSPEDNLTIDDFFKAISYATLFKGLGERVNQIPAQELTVSLFRHGKPEKMMRELTNLGCNITCDSPGVYYVKDFIRFPVQIVVTKELENENHEALRILTPHAEEEDVRSFILDADRSGEPGDRHNADAVLQASVSANHALYEKIRRSDLMCEALKELMKDEIEAAVDAGKIEARREEREKREKLEQELASKDQQLQTKDQQLQDKDSMIKKLTEELTKLKSGAAIL